MGNRRFKLSDMVPNAMFYKLEGMNRAPPDLPSCQNSSLPSSNAEKTRQYHSAGTSLPRKSYHVPRDISRGLPHPPRRSSKQGRIAGKSKPKSSSSSSACSFGCRASSESTWTRTVDAGSPDSTFGSSSPEFRLDRVLTPESLGSCGRRVDRVVNDPDIVIDVDQNSSIRKPERATRDRYFESLPNLELPRIVTKPAKPKHSHKTNHVDAKDRVAAEKPTKKAGENGSRKSASKGCSISPSPRLRLKIKSPRPTSRRPTQARRAGSGIACGQSDPPTVRTKLSGSFAVVKSSFDPQRDFRESMVEMIVQHNIKASKDLEELLACYLSLNTSEYHELIIEVFKQIWFDLADHHSFHLSASPAPSERC